MKYSFLLFLSIILMSQQCKEHQSTNAASEEQAECIDPSKIQDGPCTKIYKPVCGCNGITYANACIAENNGLLTWTEGECVAPGDDAATQ